MSFAIINKTLRDHWKSTLGWAFGLLSIISLQLYIYPTAVTSSGAMQEYLDAFPEAFKTIFRMEDYFSGEGFLGTELFSLMFPLIFISVSAARGSSAIGSEIESGTADILFSLPLSRQRILLSKLAALVLEIIFLSGLAVTVIVIGAGLVDMEIAPSKLFIATSASAIMGLIYGSISLLAGALTGRRGAATGLSITVAIAALVFYSLAPVVSTFDYVTPFNPMDWAINGNPLSDGVSGLSFIKLLGTYLLVSFLAISIFNRRDIKS